MLNNENSNCNIFYTKIKIFNNKMNNYYPIDLLKTIFFYLYLYCYKNYNSKITNQQTNTNKT